MRRIVIVVRPRHDPAGFFTGGTKGTECLSELGGSACATSHVKVRPGRMESWDRGFDAGGAQVWGAERGGRVFPGK